MQIDMEMTTSRIARDWQSGLSTTSWQMHVSTCHMSLEVSVSLPSSCYTRNVYDAVLKSNKYTE